MKKQYLPAEQRFLKQIGNNIKEFRKKINTSQEQLALDSELDRAYVGKVERGKNNISVLNLKKIADALRIKASDLLKTNNK